ncbi:hypothetical protein JCM9279_006877 [Rhodotorula babjevae]
MEADLVEITAVESELLTKEFVQVPFHAAHVPYALGGLAGLAAGAENWLRAGYGVEPVASLLRTVRFPTKFAPVTVYVRPHEVQDAEDLVIYDRRHVYTPFSTYRCRWSSTTVQRERRVECFVKILPMRPGDNPGRPGERNWRTWSFIVLDQLTLAAGEAPGSDGLHAALVVVRWAFLFGTALFHSENEQHPPPPGQDPGELVDRFLEHAIGQTLAQALVGAHDVAVIDRWLVGVLTPTSVVGAADWDIAHFGAQYHALAPISQEARRRELVGQYSEIVKSLRAGLYRDRLDPPGRYHIASLAKSAYEPQSRSRRAERDVLL